MISWHICIPMIDYCHMSNGMHLEVGQMNASNEKIHGLFAISETDDLSSQAHRQLIGFLGLIFPFLLWLIAGWRSTEGLQPWQLLSSISAYYYTSAVSAFAGILIALAV